MDQGSPRYDNNFPDTDARETAAQKAAQCRRVPVPETDPIFGARGPLVEIWGQAMEEGAATDGDADMKD